MIKKKVLITGPSKGIGLAVAKRLLSGGYLVIGSSRSGYIEHVQHENFHPIALDVTNIESVKKAYQEISDRFDQLDIIINNAGIGPDLNQKTLQITSFDETFEVNVKGVVLFTETFLAKIVEKGSVIMISSKMSSIDKCIDSDSVGYRTSKSALNMYTKILANRLSESIKVVAVHPGYVKTQISEIAMINGRLTPEQSAENIFSFLKSDYKTGSFWDLEAGTELPR
jgi:NAD(P)-dependent dehydrogenase (short-subunit alcohol dehydrogenase family)